MGVTSEWPESQSCKINKIQRPTATLCGSWKCVHLVDLIPVLTRTEKTKTKGEKKQNTEWMQKPSQVHLTLRDQIIPTRTAFLASPLTCSLTPRLQGWRKPQVCLNTMSCVFLYIATQLLFWLLWENAWQLKEGRVCFWLTTQGFSPSGHREGTAAEIRGFLACICS